MWVGGEGGEGGEGVGCWFLVLGSWFLVLVVVVSDTS